MTFLLVLAIQPLPSMALGMFLVAACPGGNVSNFLSSLAKGNTALSVSLSAFSPSPTLFLTPLNFALWVGLYSPTASLLKEISLDIEEVFFDSGFYFGHSLDFRNTYPSEDSYICG